MEGAKSGRKLHAEDFERSRITDCDGIQDSKAWIKGKVHYLYLKKER